MATTITTSAVIPDMGDTEIAAKPAMADTDFVKPVKPAPPQVIALSPADQLMVDEYICFLLLFPSITGSDNAAVYSALKDGLSSTLSEIPFIGGHLTRIEGAVGERFQIEIEESYGLKFIYRDFTTSQTGFKWTYPELKQKDFPCSAFNPEELQPIAFAATKPNPAVMAVQANFIQGGLILSTCIHHKAADGLSFGTVLKTWAKHTAMIDMASANGNGFRTATNGLIPRSMSRAPLCNGLLGAQLKDFPEYRVLDDQKPISPAPSEIAATAAMPAISRPRLTSPFGPLKLCIVHISASRLAELKLAASPPVLSSDRWISTNDALCAFLWRHITRARSHMAGIIPQPGSSSSSTTSPPLNLAVAVEARRRMVPALPTEYLGNAVFYCPVTSDLATVTSPSTPLSAITPLIRSAVSGFDSAKIRGVLGLIDSIPTASDLLIRVYDDPMRGLVITSWADMGLYGSNWGPGLLGKVESVRVPNVSLDGGTPICGVFPRLPDGSLELLVCLEEPAMEVLRQDEEFTAFAQWKGM